MRRLLPFAVPALAIAAGVGAALGGAGAAWSAAIAIVVVALNFVAHAGSMAWAARISPMILMAVGLGGYVVRLAAFTVALLLLDRLAVVLPARVRRRVRAGHDRAPRDRDAAARGADAGRPLVLPGEVLAGADHVIAAILAEPSSIRPRRRTSSSTATSASISSASRSASTSSSRSSWRRSWSTCSCSCFAFRKPRTVPGKLQSLMELGLEFVREQIALPMLGPAADRFLPLLVTLFFFIFFMNMFEVAPWVNFSASSRLAFPLVLARDRLGHVQRRGDQEARVPRVPEVHVHHPERTGDPPLLAPDGDRVLLEHRDPPDHADDPSRGELRRRTLPARARVPRDRVLLLERRIELPGARR